MQKRNKKNPGFCLQTASRPRPEDTGSRPPFTEEPAHSFSSNELPPPPLPDSVHTRGPPSPSSTHQQAPALLPQARHMGSACWGEAVTLKRRQTHGETKGRQSSNLFPLKTTTLAKAEKEWRHLGTRVKKAEQEDFLSFLLLFCRIKIAS